MGRNSFTKKARFNLFSLFFLLILVIPQNGLSQFNQTTDSPQLDAGEAPKVESAFQQAWDLRKFFEMEDPREASKALREHARQNGISLDTLLPKPKAKAVEKEMKIKTPGELVHLFNGNEFIPQPGIENILSQKAEGLVAKSMKAEKIVAIMQIQGDMTMGNIIELLESNVKIYEQVGRKAMIIRLPASSVGLLKSKPYVRWLGEYKAEYKYDPVPSTSKKPGAFIYVLDGDRPEYRADLQNLGIKIRGYSDTVKSYDVILDVSRFAEVAELWWVTGISKEPEKELNLNDNLNYEPDDSREIISSFNTNFIFIGKNVKVGVYDSGIWSGNNLDFPLGSFESLGGDLGDYSTIGHGTHVCGIIASRGGRDIEGVYDGKGVAPGAKLFVVPDVEGGTYSTNDAFDYFLSNGIQISNHSWGYSNYNYNPFTKEIDEYSDKNDMAIVFSAGNDYDARKIGNPATGKNVISVGAILYVTDDLKINRKIGDRANYSSQGPTADDSRLKPEVVAPGGQTNGDYNYFKNGIVSTNNNSIDDDGSDTWDSNYWYTRMSGTSMAAPHVTGIFAKIKEWKSDIGSELMKALLINTTLPLKGNSNDPLSAYANTSVGYGLVNGYSITDNEPGESKMLLFGDSTVAAGSSQEWPILIQPDTKKLVITLAYNDLAGEESDIKALKDDLDLILIASDGTQYRADEHLAAGVTTESPVEKMVIENPAVGNWVARIEFSDSYEILPQSQRYGIVAHAIFKTPELRLSVPEQLIIVTPGENFPIKPVITNTGGYIAAGVTVTVEGSSLFTGDINKSRYVGNLMFQGDSVSPDINLTAPATIGTYYFTVKVDGINKEFDSSSYPKTAIINVIVKQPGNNILSVVKQGTGMGTVTSYPSGINCGSTCSYQYANNTSVTLTAPPDINSNFTGWSGDADCTDGIVTVNLDKTCIATFTLKQYTITANAGAGGKITPSGNILVNFGTDQTYNIIPDTGYYIKDVIVDGKFVGIVPSYIFNDVTADHTIEATFATDPYYTLKVSKSGNGTGKVTSNPAGIDCGSSCLKTYSKDTLVTLTTAPDISSSFTGWSGDADCSDGVITMDSEKNCTATFTTRTFTIAASSGSNGSITPGSLLVNYGASQTFTVTSNSGYYIKDILADGESVLSKVEKVSNSQYKYTFINITSDHTIRAVFSPGWRTETIDMGGTGNVGMYTSIARDFSDWVHISYYDATNGDLKYATNAPDGKWKTDTVDTGETENVGLFSSIAIDSIGAVHISYSSSYSYKTYSSPLKHATNKGVNPGQGNCPSPSKNWNCEIISDWSKYTSIAIDSSDNIHISYGSLSYATNRGVNPGSGNCKKNTNWNCVPVDDITASTNIDNLYIPISVDSSGAVHISYPYYYNYNFYLKYATNRGVNPGSGNCGLKNWTCKILDSAGTGYFVDAGEYSSIKVDSSGALHISYHAEYDAFKTSLNYATNMNVSPGTGNCTDDKNWNCVKVDIGSTLNGPNKGKYTSIGIDSKGGVHISSFGDSSYSSYNDLRYTTNAIGYWFTRTIYNEGLYTSLAIDSADNVHVSYYDSTNGDLKYATNAPLTSQDVDYDGDGFTANEGDCNESDPTIYPGAPEKCDGRANDCNNLSKADGSGEGWYGAACDGPGDSDECKEGIYQCVSGAQTCADNTDDNIEVCDGIDNDCDGQTDELSANTYYKDADGDGYGDPSSAASYCQQPEGYVSNFDDCDDTDPFEHPDQTWYKDMDDDKYSDGPTEISCERPYGYKAEPELTATSGDCDDNDLTVSPGASEACDGKDNDCSINTLDGSGEIWYGAVCDGFDLDLCKEGVYQCVNGNKTCSDTAETNKEVCDGYDNDCNPATADGSGESWYGVACDGPDSDLCNEGKYQCIGRTKICSDNTGDNMEGPYGDPTCRDYVDNDCDGDINDNDSDCKALPDLIVKSVSNPPAKRKPGGSFNITANIKNKGVGAADKEFTAACYLSKTTDKRINKEADTFAGVVVMSSLVAGASSKETIQCTIPVNTDPERYYVKVCADNRLDVAESNEDNNCLASVGKIRVK